MEAVIPFALASAPVPSGAAYVTGPTARGGKELPPLSTRGIELGTSREHLRVCGLARTTSATWGGGGGVQEVRSPAALQVSFSSWWHNSDMAALPTCPPRLGALTVVLLVTL